MKISISNNTKKKIFTFNLTSCSVSLFVYLFTLSLLFIVTRQVVSSSSSSSDDEIDSPASSFTRYPLPKSSSSAENTRHRHQHPVNATERENIGWVVSLRDSSIDWEPTQQRGHWWPLPSGLRKHQWRRVSSDDHEQQFTEEQQPSEVNVQFDDTEAGRRFHRANYETLSSQMTATTSNNKSVRQTRQVDHKQQPSIHHTLSQEHVILDHHSSFQHHVTHHPLPQAAQSLIFIQSRSGGESDNAETFYIRKGANGTLPCLPVLPADSQATQSKIEWFKEEKKLMEAEAKRIVVWSTKNSIAYLPETGALLFRGVTNEDSGEYHCVLTKLNGESEDGIVRFYVQGKSELCLLKQLLSSVQRFLRDGHLPSRSVSSVAAAPVAPRSNVFILCRSSTEMFAHFVLNSPLVVRMFVCLDISVNWTDILL